jgi:hypothetical protein
MKVDNMHRQSEGGTQAFMTQPVAYYDESWTQQAAFVVAGYVASAAVWSTFESRWNEALHAERLAEFKMGDCDHAREQFKGWSIAERHRAQKRLISIIISSGALGVFSGIALRPYNRLTPTIRTLLHPKTWKPYHLAFQHQIELTAMVIGQLPSNEKIAFVFDEQTEFQSNGLAQYRSLTQSKMPFVQRLGTVAFESSTRYPGLQAAGVLAFEVRRYLMERVYRITFRSSARWQMLLLNKGRLRGGYSNEGALMDYVRTPRQSSHPARR